MPVCNEIDFIERSLGAVISQDYPQNLLQIIVADGLSTDGTRKLLSDLQASHPNILVVDNPRKIVPTGINKAMQLATGEIIIRIDGHCEIASDYVLRCVEYLQTGKAEGVGGPIETVGRTYLARVIACAMSSRFGVGGSAFRTGTKTPILTDTVAFPAYTREVTERAGPYDEELVRNQDDEYNYRIRKLGGRLLLAPNIRSQYFSRSSLYSLWRQYFQYGYWKIRVVQKHPRQMSARQFVPLLFVLALLTSIGFGLAFDFGKWIFLAVVMSYLLANLISTISIGATRGWVVTPLLPVVYAILHFSYGLGNVFGLIKFWRRWTEPEVIDGQAIQRA